MTTGSVSSYIAWFVSKASASSLHSPILVLDFCSGRTSVLVAPESRFQEGWVYLWCRCEECVGAFDCVHPRTPGTNLYYWTLPDQPNHREPYPSDSMTTLNPPMSPPGEVWTLPTSLRRYRRTDSSTHYDSSGRPPLTSHHPDCNLCHSCPDGDIWQCGHGHLISSQCKAPGSQSISWSRIGECNGVPIEGWCRIAFGHHPLKLERYKED